jgi:hypothetical protein
MQFRDQQKIWTNSDIGTHLVSGSDIGAHLVSDCFAL